ncbi:hypothetical protein [Providencia rustigianii]|uniref:hypothetical protein n=1 Tax=Providencia rustigianii TaxID=158850 RepID=UPI000D884FB2|nr:hypothetical protein [Providencia rustigianii]SPY77115.1 Uncharacterised protein [Providencia rustigianii]
MAISLYREWLSYSEVVMFLAERQGMQVSIGDIARLVADETIPASIYFQSPTPARKVSLKTVPLSAALEDSDALIKANLEMLHSDAVMPDVLIQHAIPINNEIIRVEGLWDALPYGVTKHFNECLYSKSIGLSEPKRSLYSVRGIILIKGNDLYQVLAPVDVRESLKMLEAMRQAHADCLNPLVDKHIAQLTHILNQINNGEYVHQLMPCTNMPIGTLPVIKNSNILKLTNTKKVDKKESSKTSNAMAQYIYGLTCVKYGKDIADNPRSHIDNPRGVIKLDFESLGLPLPKGNTVSGWLKNIDL